MGEDKRCTRCGKIKPLCAFTKHGAGSWCKECHAEYNRERRRRGGAADGQNRNLSAEQVSKLRAVVAETGSLKAAAEMCGMSPSTVQKYASDVLAEFKAKRAESILRLRAEGHTYDEIEKALGCGEGPVSKACKSAGIGGRIRCGGWSFEDPEKKAARLNAVKKKYEIEFADKVNALGYEYIGGYRGSNGYATLRCPICGAVFEASCITIRKYGHITCLECAEKKRRQEEETRAETRAKAQAQKKLERERRTAEKKAKIIAEREAKRNRICKECGQPFEAVRGKYCSSDCRRKADNRRRDARRRGYRLNIPLSVLYERDGGICYLCGRLCDFDDYLDTDGAWVIGNSYPTVEHVIPLCKGGDDSWENVRLACFACNTKKGRRSSLRVEQSGQIALVI